MTKENFIVTNGQIISCVVLEKKKIKIEKANRYSLIRILLNFY